MAVPFRRTSKTKKRKRRTHKKLSLPNIYKNKKGEFIPTHLMNKDTGFYREKKVVEIKEKK